LRPRIPKPTMLIKKADRIMENHTSRRQLVHRMSDMSIAGPSSSSTNAPHSAHSATAASSSSPTAPHSSTSDIATSSWSPSGPHSPIVLRTSGT
jgi:hypothetical protein